MIIKREKYLKQLVESCGNGMIKVVTGVRRCGKSFLLFKLFRNYLMEQGVDDERYNRIYVQSAFTIDSLEKTEQELSSLKNLKDGFRKIVIVGGLQPTYINEDGIYIVNLTDFLQSPERFLSL